MVEITFVCPVCDEQKSVEIDARKIILADKEPVPIVVTHGEPEHAVTLFIDRKYKVRAISVTEIVERIERERRTYIKRFIPVPMSRKVPLDDLEPLQAKVVTLADGEKTVEEIAEILNLPKMRVKIICEQLVRMGRLDSVRVVIKEE